VWSGKDHAVSPRQCRHAGFKSRCAPCGRQCAVAPRLNGPQIDAAARSRRCARTTRCLRAASIFCCGHLEKLDVELLIKLLDFAPSAQEIDAGLMLPDLTMRGGPPRRDGVLMRCVNPVVPDDVTRPWRCSVRSAQRGAGAVKSISHRHGDSAAASGSPRCRAADGLPVCRRRIRSRRAGRLDCACQPRRHLFGRSP